MLGTWDSYGTEQLLLRHGPEWEGLAIDATFHNVPNDEGVTVLADTDGLVTVPPEACMRASKYATITFRGVQDGVQRISCSLPYIVLDHAQVPGSNSTATPSENAQALAQMQDLRDGAVDAKNQAEAARDGAANSATDAAASEKAAASSAVAAAAVPHRRKRRERRRQTLPVMHKVICRPQAARQPLPMQARKTQRGQKLRRQALQPLLPGVQRLLPVTLRLPVMLLQGQQMQKRLRWLHRRCCGQQGCCRKQFRSCQDK